MSWRLLQIDQSIPVLFDTVGLMWLDRTCWSCRRGSLFCFLSLAHFRWRGEHLFGRSRFRLTGRHVECYNDGVWEEELLIELGGAKPAHHNGAS